MVMQLPPRGEATHTLLRQTAIGTTLMVDLTILPPPRLTRFEGVHPPCVL